MAAGTAAGQARHGLRIFLLWLPLAVAADLLIWLALGPHLPPGTMASAAANQQSDFVLMAVLAAPVMLFVLVYFGYALAVWRQRPGDETDGPPLHGNVRAQASFIGISSVIVLALAVFGTVELISAQGAGAGQGPDPIWKPAAAGQGGRNSACRSRSSASSGSSPTATRSSAASRRPSWCSRKASGWSSTSRRST